MAPRQSYIERPSPLIVDHPTASAMLALEPDELKQAGDKKLIDFHTKRPSDKRPHRYYLVADLITLSHKLKDAGCLATLLISSSAASAKAKSPSSGMKTSPSKGRTGHVYDFESALAQTTAKPHAR